MTRIRVGIGGWTFAPWRGVFYPAGLKHADELGYASRQLTSIEINGTFYGAQKPASFRRWRDETPDGFVFSVKGPRFATHRRDLAESAPSIERFFASGIVELGDKLGPVLWQFPATTKFEPDNIAAFLALLPHAIDGRTIRHVLEARHPSFADAGFARMLQPHNVAAALIDDASAPIEPGSSELGSSEAPASADFIYARLKRADAECPTGYAPAALGAWRYRFCRRAEDDGTPRDCFVYFINGGKVRAPAAAMAFIAMLAADDGVTSR
jgi:uncharacterized protein YecE (DUF72 family)